MQFQRTAIAQRIELHVLKEKRVLKSVQLQVSPPKPEERHARLREKQSLDLIYRWKWRHDVVGLIGPADRRLNWAEVFLGSWYSRKEAFSEGVKTGRNIVIASAACSRAGTICGAVFCAAAGARLLKNTPSNTIDRLYVTGFLFALIPASPLHDGTSCVRLQVPLYAQRIRSRSEKN